MLSGRPVILLDSVVFHLAKIENVWKIYSGCHLTICEDHWEFLDFFRECSSFFFYGSHFTTRKEGRKKGRMDGWECDMFAFRGCVHPTPPHPTIPQHTVPRASQAAAQLCDRVGGHACISNFFHSISNGKGFHYWRRNQSRIPCKFVLKTTKKWTDTNWISKWKEEEV